MQEKYLYRKIATLIKGQNLGGITRYISPAYYGQLTKPFVFLDYVRILPNQPLPKFGFHPHSGIATLTFMLEGESWYEETSGKKGILNEGDIEWMSSGGGVWHRGGPQSPPVRGFQLWIALPPEQESSPPRSQYIKKDDIPQEGSATVLLGRYGSSHSPVQTPVDINYLSVTLEKNQRWVMNHLLIMMLRGYCYMRGIYWWVSNTLNKVNLLYLKRIPNQSSLLLSSMQALYLDLRHYIHTH